MIADKDKTGVSPINKVSIPEMVRLIAVHECKLFTQLIGFNSRDGAIDRMQKILFALSGVCFNSRDGAIDRLIESLLSGTVK